MNSSEVPSAKTPRRPRQAKLTAPLSGGRTITFTGLGDSLDELTGTLEELLTKAKKAKAAGLSLKTFLSILEDQSNRSTKS